MPIGEGASLGQASGAIVIDTRGVTGAQATVQTASVNMERSLGRVGKGAATAQAGLAGLAKSAVNLGGALGIGLGASVLVQTAGRLTLDSIQQASDLTEAINKTGVAFATSKDDILDWSKTSSSALGQSRQQALEAASSFGLLFNTMGLAPSESAEMSQALVQLAADMASINNISPEEALTKLRAGLVGEIEPLRTVGVLLDAASVEAQAMEMGLANSTRALTQQDKVLARYQLILKQTALTQGDFARTSGELANQQRILAAKTADAQALLGEALLPFANIAVGGAVGWLEQQTVMARTYGDAIDDATAAVIKLGRALDLIPENNTFRINVGVYQRNQMLSGGGIGGGSTPRFSGAEGQSQLDLIRDRFTGLADIERDANNERLDATRQYEEQRTSTIRDYGKTIARDAEDFGRARVRAEQEFAASIADVRQDAAKREADQAKDLARANSQARADADERIADARADTNERLAELDEDYQRSRERAAGDHRDKLLSAASRLDAVAVMAEQRRYSAEAKDAKEAHDEQRRDLSEQLDERIADEEKALEKSTRQRQEAYDRQLEDARIADAERIADMQNDFAKRKAQEDEDRRLRMERMAADHNDQLAEMDRQHQLDLAQISTQEAESRAKVQEEFETALAELGVQTDAWIAANKLITDAAIKDFDTWWEHVQKAFELAAASRKSMVSPRGYADGGPVPYTGMAMLHAGEYVLSRDMLAAGRGGRSVTWTGNMSISIPGGTNASAQELAAVFEPLLMRSLEKIASQ